MKKILSFLFILLINNVQAQITNDYPTIKLNNDIDLIVGNHSTANSTSPSIHDTYDLRFQSKDSITFVSVYYNSFGVEKQVGFNTSGMSHLNKIGYQIGISPTQVFRTSDHERGGFDMKYVLNKKKRTKTKGTLVLKYKIKNKVKEVAIPLKKILHQTLSNTPVPRLIDQH